LKKSAPTSSACTQLAHLINLQINIRRGNAVHLYGMFPVNSSGRGRITERTGGAVHLCKASITL